MKNLISLIVLVLGISIHTQAQRWNNSRNYHHQNSGNVYYQWGNNYYNGPSNLYYWNNNSFARVPRQLSQLSNYFGHGGQVYIRSEFGYVNWQGWVSNGNFGMNLNFGGYGNTFNQQMYRNNSQYNYKYQNQNRVRYWR